MFLHILRLKLAIERKHHCHARHVGSRIVVEPLPDGGMWRGKIEVFDLTNEIKADRCYAWIEQREVRAVCFTRLRIPPVKSAQTAVRAVLASRSLAGRVPAH